MNDPKNPVRISLDGSSFSERSKSDPSLKLKDSWESGRVYERLSVILKNLHKILNINRRLE